MANIVDQFPSNSKEKSPSDSANLLISFSHGRVHVRKGRPTNDNSKKKHTGVSEPARRGSKLCFGALAISSTHALLERMAQVPFRS